MTARSHNQFLGELEALRVERGNCPPVSQKGPTVTAPGKRSVRNWMVANRDDYQTSTQLAEAAAAQFDFPGDPLSDETHWIWDYAFDVLGDGMG